MKCLSMVGDLIENALRWTLRLIRLACIGILYLLVAACVAWAGMALYQQDWIGALSYLLIGGGVLYGLVFWRNHGESFGEWGWDDDDDDILTDPSCKNIPGNIYHIYKD